ncbi:MAG: hypothetical protein PHO32_09270 [Candidatus Cloacimonetes bacterium]|nr:hypothetical protein [Candidatus Cloacimonadota bacterium]
MKKDYNDIMDTLVGVSENLLQVAVYTTTAPRCVIILDRDPANLLESMEPVREYVNKRHLPFPL